MDLSKKMKTVEWKTSKALVNYKEAVGAMEKRSEAIYSGLAREQVWLLEHPELYTAGTSAKPKDLIDKNLFPVYQTGRGGQYTYHGPGQRVAYVMLDLRKRGRNLKAFINTLEEWLILTLADFAIVGERLPGHIGIWVECEKTSKAKIAAIGIRVRRWITLHGISLNVNPNLLHYKGIVPCGVKKYGLTSLKDQGITTSNTLIDAALKRSFGVVFEEK